MAFGMFGGHTNVAEQEKPDDNYDKMFDYGTPTDLVPIYSS